jgi:plastocyanin
MKRGDTIGWINKAPFPHTVTAKGVFDSESSGAKDSQRVE